jgi:hypothetical protein
MNQKEKIALEIAATIASVNVPLKPFLSSKQLLSTDKNMFSNSLTKYKRDTTGYPGVNKGGTPAKCPNLLETF